MEEKESQPEIITKTSQNNTQIPENENNISSITPPNSENNKLKSKTSSNINHQSSHSNDNLFNLISNNRSRISDKIESEDDYINKINQRKKNIPHYGNVGNNIIFCKKYVWGLKSTLILLILTMIGISITYFAWIFSNGNFYPKIIYYLCTISYFLTEFFMFLTFITEPGIIPRKDPKFQKIHEEINDNKKENIPRIFKERKCETCEIIRPPGTSHCRICNNCVQEFDHHCYYISNCVGKRNHKYFYLFLLFGTICAIEVIIFDSITVFYVFILKWKNIWPFLFKANKWFLILSIFLMTLGIFFACSMVRDFGCIFIPIAIGIALFLYMFHQFVPINNNTPTYFNPYIILVLMAAGAFGIFVIATFCGQTFFISSGFTIKQRDSIRKQIIGLYGDNKNVSEEYTRKKTFYEQCKNIKNFLLEKVEKSLIIPERDLIK